MIKLSLYALNIFIFFFSLINHATAQSRSPDIPKIYVGLYGGIADIDGAYKNDGQFIQARLSLGLTIWNYHTLRFATELGIDSGNIMRLQIEPNLIDATGGLPVQANLKPYVDLLFNLQYQCMNKIFFILKGGVAYRQLQLMNRSSAQDSIKKFDPELQLGLGISITKNSSLNILYQGIYSGGNASVKQNADGDITINRIPTQQAILLGVDFYINAI